MIARHPCTPPAPVPVSRPRWWHITPLGALRLAVVGALALSVATVAIILWSAAP